MARDERIYPDVANGNFSFHLFRYLWAMRFAYDKRVLDAGCGSGYGAALLAGLARSVVAVDHDPEAIAEDQSRYAYRNNLDFLVQDVADLSFQDQSFDLIVSFEVYEHLDLENSERFLHHLWRLCRLGGWVLLSTPNRLVETPFLKSSGKSYSYHVNSVSPREFKGRLQAHFGCVRVLGQRIKAPWFKGMLRALDFFNLRHQLLSYKSKQRLDGLLSGRESPEPPDLWQVQLERSFVRQSGILVAVCRK